MTVVSAMKFNGKSGAIVTDEEGTYGYRRSPTFSKIDDILEAEKMLVLMGSSGNADVLRDVGTEIISTVQKKSR